MSDKSNFRKIPYETIVLAVNGDAEALNKIVLHFRGFTRSVCMRSFKDEDGYERWCVDEEMQERVEAKLKESIVNRFKPY